MGTIKFLILAVSCYCTAATTTIKFGDLQLHLLAGGEIIRVTVLPNGGGPTLKQKPPPLAVPEKTWDPVAYNLTHSGKDETIIKLDDCSVVINTTSLALTFLNSADTIVLQEKERRFTKITDTDPMNTTSFTAQQSFVSPPGESIYGGGSFQQGFLGLRNAPLLLQERNTEAVVPFFVSTSGWGLLWDNAGATWLNPVDEFATELDMKHSSPRHKQPLNSMTTSTSFFTPVSTGAHFFTLHCPTVAYGDSILSVANVSLRATDRGNNREDVATIPAIAWNARNKPPTHTGRVLGLEVGVQYEVTLECENCCVSFHDNYDQGNVQLFISQSAEGQTTLRSALADYIDYYVVLPRSDQAIARSSASGSGSGGTPTSSQSASLSLLDRCIAGYRVITGAAPLLPKWTYGFWQSKEHYHNRTELLWAARQFRSRGIPVDAIVQDWKYWGDLGWSPQWDPLIYPNPSSMVQELHDMSYHFMVSVWCKFENISAYLSPLHKTGQLLPGTNFLDIFQPEAQDSLFDYANESMYAIGVDALWLDATEPEGFVHTDKTVFPYGSESTGVSSNALLNSYSLAVTAGITDRLALDYPGTRPFHLTRSFTTGQQRTYGVLWSGDISGSWDMLRRQVQASLNFALSGSPYWSMDTGGFFRPSDQYDSADYQELLVRWFQVAAFVPITRYHGQGGELWLYGENATDLVNRTLTLRYRCLPYIYALAHRVEVEGYTMMRHFAFDFMHDRDAMHVEDAFMFGPALLVAPVTASKATTRSVYLPTPGGRPGGEAEVEPETYFWNFWTGTRHRGGTTVEAWAPLDSSDTASAGPPLFCRMGSILPLGPQLQWTDSQPPDPLEVRVYTGAAASFTLYEDGGLDQSYRSGAYSSILLTWEDSDGTGMGTFRMAARKGDGYKGMLQSRRIRVVLVREGHGVGVEEVQAADAELLYVGEEISIDLSIK